jgi:hypothetical protein
MPPIVQKDYVPWWNVRSPLVSLLSGRFATADAAMRKLMLEAITRRYYRIRSLENQRSLTFDGHCYAAAEYDHEGKRIHVFTTHAEYSRLPEAMQAMFPLVADVPVDHEIVIDFYLWNPGQLGDPEVTQREVQSLLNQAGFSRPIRRIAIAVPGPAVVKAWMACSISLIATTEMLTQRRKSIAGCIR